MSVAQKSRLGRSVMITFMALLLAIAIMIPLLLLGSDAKALDINQWAAIRGYLDDFITTQYTSGNEGGFIIEADTGAGNCDAATLRGRLDSNCDGTMLGEGDDAAQSPILVDVLTGGGGGIIPGTALITTWNASNTFNPASQENTLAIANLVTQHENAGFSTDIISYCMTGHTESVAAGAMGAISYAGAYGGSTIPKVYDLKWGRYGWASGSRTYSNENALGTAGVSPTYAFGTNGNCGSASTDAEATRCVAEWALDSAGGNVGNGTGPPWTAYQVIDLRQSPGANSPTDSAITFNVPLDTVFNTGLIDINQDGTYGKVLAANDTQHTAGMVAVGLEMLGYDSTFSQWGAANYNYNIGEQFNGATDSMGYGLVSPGTQPGTAPWLVDTTAPSITVGPAGGNLGQTTADVTWTTDEPATSKIVLGTSSGGPYNVSVPAQDTILHASHTVSVTGLSGGTTYYGKAYSYDGMGNETISSEFSFVTISPNDRYLYLPWYDSVTASGLRSWINISNLEDHTQTGIEVKVGNTTLYSGDLASGGQLNLQQENLIGGPAYVRIPDGLTSGDTLVVSERTLYMNSFNENLAYDKANASSQFGFPWYDNNAPSGMLGDWFAIVNVNAEVIDVEIYIDGALAITRQNIAGGAVDAFQLPTTTTDGPVKVVAYLDDTPGTPKDIICSQRVIFWDSFNEVFGMPLV